MESDHGQERRRAVRETLGTLGVIASLIFVGTEIQQNNTALRAAAIQEMINVARQQTQMLATNPDLVRIGQMIDRGEPVTEVEEEQYRWVRVSFMWGMQGLFRQWDEGVLPDRDWEAWRRVICSNMESPALRDLWRSRLRDTYVPDFIAIVEACPSYQAE